MNKENGKGGGKTSTAGVTEQGESIPVVDLGSVLTPHRLPEGEQKEPSAPSASSLAPKVAPKVAHHASALEHLHVTTSTRKALPGSKGSMAQPLLEKESLKPVKREDLPATAVSSSGEESVLAHSAKKKPKLEDKDEPPQDELMIGRPLNPPVFGGFPQGQVFDISGEDDELEGAREGGSEGWAGTGIVPQHLLSSKPPEGGMGIPPREFVTPINDMPNQHVKVDGAPDWVNSLMQSMQSMHIKQDQQHRDVMGIALEVDEHATRLELLEQVSKENTDVSHDQGRSISQLAKDVVALQQQTHKLQEALKSSRPNTPQRGRSPSPRRLSPISTGREEFSLEELDVVIGGWQDAKRTEAEAEVQKIFEAVGLSQGVKTTFSPYPRTNFLRITLNFEDEDAPIGVLRTHQNTVLQKLKAQKFTSGLPGSQGRTLWVTRHRSVEDRIKVRALVTSKEFFQRVPLAEGRTRAPDGVEIDWRGKLFWGPVQLLGNAVLQDPSVYDQLIPDARGNHTQWYIDAKKFQAVTGRADHELQQLWTEYGPDAHPRE